MINNISIESKKKDIPFDFWKHPKFNNFNSSCNNIIINFDNYNNNFIDEIYKNESVSVSNGFLVNYRDNIYVITCYHGIKNGFENKILINNYEYFLKPFINILEFDLAIFTINNFNLENKEKNNIINIHDIDTKIPEINTKIKIITNKNTINTKIVNISESDIGNQTFSIIPQIHVKNNKKKLSDLFGISGSMCIDNKNNLIGYVFSLNPDENTINIIPSYCLKYVFTYIVPNNIKYLKSININGNLCSIYDDIKTTTSYAYKINKTENIEYKDNKNKYFNFKKGMLICEIDNNILDENGKIYFDLIGIPISIKTYILLNNKDLINIKGYETLNGKYNSFEINIEPENLMDYMIFSLEGHNKIVIYKNFIIAELSRDLLDLIKVINKDSKIKERLENPYFKKYHKELVLIDIIDKYSDNDKHIENLKKKFNENNLIFLNKLNKKNIYSLEELSNELKNNNENNFIFEIKKSTYKTLTY